MDDTIDLSAGRHGVGRLPRNGNVTDIWDMEHDHEFLKRKVDVAQHVLAIEDPELLDTVYSLLMNASIPEDWYERLSDQDREEIRQARIEFEAGDIVQNEDVIERMRSWTKK